MELINFFKSLWNKKEEMPYIEYKWEELDDSYSVSKPLNHMEHNSETMRLEAEIYSQGFMSEEEIEILYDKIFSIIQNNNNK